MPLLMPIVMKTIMTPERARPDTALRSTGTSRSRQPTEAEGKTGRPVSRTHAQGTHHPRPPSPAGRLGLRRRLARRRPPCLPSMIRLAPSEDGVAQGRRVTKEQHEVRDGSSGGRDWGGEQCRHSPRRSGPGTRGVAGRRVHRQAPRRRIDGRGPRRPPSRGLRRRRDGGDRPQPGRGGPGRPGHGRRRRRRAGRRRPASRPGWRLHHHPRRRGRRPAHPTPPPACCTSMATPTWPRPTPPGAACSTPWALPTCSASPTPSSPDSASTCRS